MDVDEKDVEAASCVLEARVDNTLVAATCAVDVDSTCGSVEAGEVGHRVHKGTCISCGNLVLVVSQASW